MHIYLGGSGRIWAAADRQGKEQNEVAVFQIHLGGDGCFAVFFAAVRNDAAVLPE